MKHSTTHLINGTRAFRLCWHKKVIDVICFMYFPYTINMLFFLRWFRSTRFIFHFVLSVIFIVFTYENTNIVLRRRKLKITDTWKLLLGINSKRVYSDNLHLKIHEITSFANWKHIENNPLTFQHQLGSCRRLFRLLCAQNKCLGIQGLHMKCLRVWR